MRNKSTWIRVSREQPCEVCGKPDYCTRAADGTVAKCMRVESEQKAKGELGGWIHKINGKPMTVAKITKREIEERDWSQFAQKAFERKEAAAMRLEVAKVLGIDTSALERLRVGYGFDDYRRLSYSTWPETRPGGKVLGIIRRYSVPVSESGGNKLTMQGSKHGLYLPREWWHGAGPVLICEGGSDTAAVLTIGLSAIGRPSNIGGVNMLIGALRDCERPIVVVGERDRKPDRVGTMKHCKANCDGCSWCYPGRYGARVTAERLKRALPKARLVWRMPPAGAKDVREWLNNTLNPTAAKLLNRLALT